MTMQYPNSRIYSYQSGAAAMVAMLLLLMSATAAMSKPCLTKEEARKLWPNEWLYWHFSPLRIRPVHIAHFTDRSSMTQSPCHELIALAGKKWIGADQLRRLLAIG